MKFIRFVAVISPIIFSILVGGCNQKNNTDQPSQTQPDPIVLAEKDRPQTLMEARASFQTDIVDPYTYDEKPLTPPKNIFSLVYYPAKDGEMSAYLTPDPKDGKKHPAVIWISGGFGGQGGNFWSPAPRDNDQTGSAFRKAGLILMLPSFRGESGNPGVDEMFYGEIDDLDSARKYLASQPYVDPDRIYLVGHSTGGTRVLLASELLTGFRAFFSLGGVFDIKKWWGEDDMSFFPFNTEDPKEFKLRSAGYFIESIRFPTFYFEGEKSYDRDFDKLAATVKANNIPLALYSIKGGNHFNIITPITEKITQKILLDNEEEININFDGNDIKQIEDSLRN